MTRLLYFGIGFIMKTTLEYIPCEGCGADLSDTICKYCGRESVYVFWTRERYDEKMREFLAGPGYILPESFPLSGSMMYLDEKSCEHKEVILKL